MNVKVITPALGPLITLAQAKEYLRVTHDLENNSITQMLNAATKLCERYCRVFFLPQTVRATLRIPSDPAAVEWEGIHLAGGDVQEIEDLQLVAKGETLAGVMLEGTNWWTRKEGEKTFLMLDRLMFTQIIRDSEPESLAVTYKAGMVGGTTLDQQRSEFSANYSDILEAVSVVLNLFYDTRGVSNVSITMQAKRLLDSYRTTAFAEI